MIGIGTGNISKKGSIASGGSNREHGKKITHALVDKTPIWHNECGDQEIPLVESPVGWRELPQAKPRELCNGPGLTHPFPNLLK